MRELNKRIIGVRSGYRIPDKNLEMAIIVAIMIQGARYKYKYGPPTKYGAFAQTTEPDVRAVLEGRMFPSKEQISMLVTLFDEHVDMLHPNGFPVPKTTEVIYLYEYIIGQRDQFDNPMIVDLTRDQIRKEQVAAKEEAKYHKKLAALKPHPVQQEVKKKKRNTRYLAPDVLPQTKFIKWGYVPRKEL